MHRSLTRLALPLLACGVLHAEPRVIHTFQKLHLDGYYWSEGATFGDLNRDGKPDAISGPYWWEGPDFVQRHEFYPSTTTFNIKQADGTTVRYPGFEGVLGKRNAYSTDNFFSFVHDFNGDGWNDILTYGLPGTPAYLYINPAGREQHWVRHTVFDAVDNESPTLADVLGDGLPRIICNSGGTFGFAGAPAGTIRVELLDERGTHHAEATGGLSWRRKSTLRLSVSLPEILRYRFSFRIWLAGVAETVCFNGATLKGTPSR